MGLTATRVAPVDLVFGKGWDGGRRGGGALGAPGGTGGNCSGSIRRHSSSSRRRSCTLIRQYPCPQLTHCADQCPATPDVSLAELMSNNSYPGHDAAPQPAQRTT
ncbi:hypothetical protein DL770_004865 [Monosporascus sp. CRB-9-2]|nr:hypothetical protein DL770_004865 [Monosporascus sp. CRB-9-2]